MAVSVFTLIALIFSIIIVAGAPFITLFIGKKRGDKKLSGFIPGILCFCAVFVIIVVLWSLLGMDNAIEKFLGSDDTVETIRQTILYVFYAIVETFAFIFICRHFCKKGENTPYRALRFAGGYAIPEAIYVLLYLVLPLIIIITNGGIEFNIGEKISLGSISEAGASEYLFKALWRSLSLVVYAASMYLIFTGVRYDAKWFFFISPILNLGLDLPYTYTAINSRKWTSNQVTVVNVYWKTTRLATILMSLTVIIALIICRAVYKNYYMPEEKKQALKEKKLAKKQKKAEKKLKKQELKQAKKLKKQELKQGK